jgi:hypothetical protein
MRDDWRRWPVGANYGADLASGQSWRLTSVRFEVEEHG